MKQIKFLLMLLAVVAMGVCFTSCGDDGSDPIVEDESFSLVGTIWTYSEKAEQDGVQLEYDYSIIFSSKTASYEMKLTLTEGSQTNTVTDHFTYEYTYSDGLVIFTPTQAGNAYLEGVITSNIKMVVTNESTGKQIGTFYKQ